jgi:hypothetical protein
MRSRVVSNRRRITVVGVAGASTVIPFAIYSSGVQLASAILFASVCLTALALTPLAFLPALSLILFALIPTQYLPLDTMNAAWSPSLIAVAVLTLRAAIAGRSIAHGLHAAVVVAASAWVALATILSVNRGVSIAWGINFLALTMIPAMLLPTWPKAREHVEKAWISLGGILGIYGVFEYFLGANVVYDSLYQYGATQLQQTWNVYRITTSLGHPLLNGTFFAISCLLGCGAILRGGRRWTIIATTASATGLLLSASRGAAVALAVGITLLVGGALLKRKEIATDKRAVGAIVAAAVLIGIFASGPLGDRAESGEAASSTITRLASISAGQQLAEHYLPLGAGPGLADTLKRQMTVGDPRRGIESSWLQVVISLGLPGTFLLAVMLLLPAMASWVARPGPAASLIAYVVAIASYNLIEATRPALLMVGLLLGLTIQNNGTDERAVIKAKDCLSQRTKGLSAYHTQESAPHDDFKARKR